jgi:hypothetical protein
MDVRKTGRVLAWAWNSRKAKVALSTIAVIVLAHFGFSREEAEKLDLAIAVVGSSLIYGIAKEDAAEKASAAGGQVNVAEVTNVSPPQNFKGNALLLLLSASLVFLAAGCASSPSAFVEADALRKDAVAPVIAEHAQRHPEQAQTWAYFLRAWERDLAAARGKPATTEPAKSE